MLPQAQKYISGCENFLFRVVLSKTDTPSSQYLSIMQLKLLMTPSPPFANDVSSEQTPRKVLELCAKPPCYAKGSLTWGL